MDAKLKQLVRKFALDNARKYKGTPNIGAVIGKVLGERPELKSELKTLSKDIKAVCDEVAKRSVEQQEEELRSIAPELLEKRGPEEKTLKPLPNATKGKVVMRLAPSPSGPLHIGHAIVFPLSDLYCKEYEGKLILRIEDTNPENIYEPAYKMIEEEMQWLSENNVQEVIIQSDRMETYYDFAQKLVVDGRAYVCTCNPDIFRDLVSKKQACPCRDLDKKEQQLRWDKMFVEYEPGEAVLRIKTDIEDPNPAMRDWPAFRINRHKHPRTGDKYRVWPLMNFSVAVDDHKLGITHTIRGKDHMDNARRQKTLFDYMAWIPPEHSYTGLVNFEGLEVSSSKTRKRIEYGEFSGWDDPRLPTVAAFRRRGFQPGAFQKFALNIGLGMNDKTVPAADFFKSLEAHNRDIIDPIANRYFVVVDPIKIDIEGAREQEVMIPRHPDDPKKGKRTLKVTGAFYISEQDANNIEEGKLYRLKDCLNFKKQKGKFVFVDTDYKTYREEGTDVLHWVSEEHVKVSMRMPDNAVKEGLGERELIATGEDELIQAERFGFCRVDKVSDEKIELWFAHK